MLDRDSGDPVTSLALKVLMRDLGYVEGHQDGDGRWLDVRLTPAGHDLFS